VARVSITGSSDGFLGGRLVIEQGPSTLRNWPPRERIDFRRLARSQGCGRKSESKFSFAFRTKVHPPPGVRDLTAMVLTKRLASAFTRS
jgi:hypothetical protein